MLNRLIHVLPILALVMAINGCKKDAPIESKQSTEVLFKNLEIAWGMAFLPNGDFIFTERNGNINLAKKGAGNYTIAMQRAVANGEGGLLGLALDPDFTSNNYLYIYETVSEGNRVVRLKLENDLITEDMVILGGIPQANNHDGGALAFGPDGYLYVGTGDALMSNLAQDKNSLAGKILRIDRDGNAAQGNPFNTKIWSYGHRNVQGFTWNKQGNMLATEHGPSGEFGWCCHDEVNLIKLGKNYGWPLALAGTETDSLTPPLFQSGGDTWAPSGCQIVKGNEWGEWKDNLIVCGLRGQALLLFKMNAEGTEIESKTEFFKGEFGRIRNIIQAPDGSLLFSTSNFGSTNPPPQIGDDKIIRLYWD